MGESRITEGMICAVAPDKDTCNVCRTRAGYNDLIVICREIAGVHCLHSQINTEVGHEDNKVSLLERLWLTGGYSVIGITSWGDGCARPGTLGVYTNLQFYMDWLANQFGFSGIGRLPDTQNVETFQSSP